MKKVEGAFVNAEEKRAIDWLNEHDVEWKHYPDKGWTEYEAFLNKLEEGKGVAQLEKLSKAQQAAKKGRPTNEVRDARAAVQEIFNWGIEASVKDTLDRATNDYKSELQKYTEEVKKGIETYIDKNKVMEIRSERGVTHVKGLTHYRFPEMLKAATTSFPLMLVGPAGTGKTYACEQLAEALSLPFYATSVSSQTSKLDLVGYMNANGGYVVSAFRKAYEEGGVFLMDEIDAGNPNVLVVLNNALSGSMCSFPDQMVERHKDFLFVSTANTYGNGASRQYVGRNQIDAATLDRFITIDWDIDEKLEEQLVSDMQYGPRWLNVVKKMRTFCETRSYRVILSPRATLKGTLLLEREISVEKVVDMVLLSTATQEQREPMRHEALLVWKNV